MKKNGKEKKHTQFNNLCLFLLKMKKKIQYIKVNFICILFLLKTTQNIIQES